MSKQDRKTKTINQWLLWLSMCAVFPTHEKTIGLVDYRDLLAKYLIKQIKRKRLNYIDFCKRNNEVAYRTAKSVFELRNHFHDTDYYDLKD